jgi:hypothetical protein
VDSPGDVSSFTSVSIVSDSKDNMHISYYEGWPNGNLKYASNASGSWQTYLVDSSGDVGEYTSIAVDSKDKVHIGYSGNGLKYVTNVFGGWESYILESSGWVSDYTSIALDSKDMVHIGYYDRTNHDLKYATNIPPQPRMNIYPISYDLGNIKVGGVSNFLGITISNIGNLDLHISGITLSETKNFKLDVNKGSNPLGSNTPTIAPGGSGTIAVTFTPSSNGLKTADLIIYSDDPDHICEIISLAGHGVKAAVYSSSAQSVFNHYYSGYNTNYNYSILKSIPNYSQVWNVPNYFQLQKIQNYYLSFDYIFPRYYPQQNYSYFNIYYR